MGRGKLQMKLIREEKPRKTTFQKRKKGLTRKAYELSVLCDVDVCVIIHTPNQTPQPTDIQTWPPNPTEINRMINLYKTTDTRKRIRKSSDLRDFFTDRKKQAEAEISKLRKDIAEMKYTKWDDRLDYLQEEELGILTENLDSKIEVAKRRMDLLQGDECLMARNSSEIAPGFYTDQSNQNLSSFIHDLYKEQKPMFTNTLNLQFPYQNPIQQNLHSLKPHQTHMPIDYYQPQFFGGSSSDNWYNSVQLNGHSVNGQMIGMLEQNMMINDPSSSMCQYALPIQTVRPGAHTQQPGISNLSDQIVASDKLNESDYISEYLMKTNNNLMTF